MTAFLKLPSADAVYVSEAKRDSKVARYVRSETLRRESTFHAEESGSFSGSAYELPSVQAVNFSCCWEPETPTLSDISFRVTRGDLFVIIGPVGSGMCLRHF